MNTTTPMHAALQEFAAAVTDKLMQITLGEPEEQLRAPFENFMGAAANALGWQVTCTGETPLPDRLGRPDYAVHLNRLLTGYVELKAVGVGAGDEERVVWLTYRRKDHVPDGAIAPTSDHNLPV